MKIQRIRLNWIGERKERNDDCMTVMEWQSEGKRRVTQPKTTRRRTVEMIQAREMKSVVKRKTGLVGKRKLWPCAPYGMEGTNKLKFESHIFVPFICKEQ